MLKDACPGRLQSQARSDTGTWSGQGGSRSQKSRRFVLIAGGSAGRRLTGSHPWTRRGVHRARAAPAPRGPGRTEGVREHPARGTVGREGWKDGRYPVPTSGRDSGTSSPPPPSTWKCGTGGRGDRPARGGFGRAWAGEGPDGRRADGAAGALAPVRLESAFDVKGRPAREELSRGPSSLM